MLCFGGGAPMGGRAQMSWGAIFCGGREVSDFVLGGASGEGGGEEG